MEYSKEIIEKYRGYSAKDLTDAGICPTCFNRASGGLVFGDDTPNILYEDEEIECTLIGNPRAPGHMIISTKEHFHDLAECPDKINEKIIRFTKQFMNILCEVYGCVRVYLCTMSDGPMNHYHMQLIPRYAYEERGAKNFVKPRKQYVYDEEKINLIRKKINNYVNNQSRNR